MCVSRSNSTTERIIEFNGVLYSDCGSRDTIHSRASFLVIQLLKIDVICPPLGVERFSTRMLESV